MLHQGCLLAGYADKVYQRVDIFYEDGGEVAYKTVVGVQVGERGCLQGCFPFTGKETTFGFCPQIDATASASLVMRVVQGLPADRQNLLLSLVVPDDLANQRISKAKADFAHRHAGGYIRLFTLRKFVWEGAS